MQRYSLAASRIGIALLLGVPTLSLAAQSTAPKSGAPRAEATPHAKGWRASGEFGIGETADDNVFLLPDARKAALDSLSAAGTATSRYHNMPSSSDYITTLRASGEVKHRGLRGHDLALTAGARYEHYQLDAERRNVSLRLNAAQSLGQGSQLRLRGQLTPRYFYRDYMADAIDLNLDGRIQSSERVYAAGTYRESEVAAGYRRRLVDGTGSRPLTASLDLDAAYVSRQYEAPFQTRDYHGPETTLGLDVETDRTRLGLSYSYGAFRATPGTAVLVLNESDFGVDLNGNGNVGDSHVRSVQMVDFSRAEQNAGLAIRRSLSRTVDARVSLEHRWRTYGSSQPYDVYNNTRRDHRDEGGLALGFRAGEHLRMELGGSAQVQRVSRSLRPSATGEVTDYTRRRIFLNWTYRR
ncbi:MAG: hypothetical protein HOQ09_13695 [Gemmatimonadaceae bacterium]|nr:hypothetical protein [Gemmatimonadaceae bacterium]